MNTDFTNLTTENLSNEHLCCIIRSKKSHPGIEAKRQWLSDRLNEGHVFRKLNAKATVFIEYAPLETAWVPVIGDNYYYLYCLWVLGSPRGNGYGKALIEYCITDAKEKGRSGICMLGAKKQKSWLSDQSFAKKFGFEVVDTTDNGYELLALSFDGTVPKFAPNAKNLKIESEELTIYYDMQCPYIYKYIEMMRMKENYYIKKYYGDFVLLKRAKNKENCKKVLEKVGVYGTLREVKEAIIKEMIKDEVNHRKTEPLYKLIPLMRQMYNRFYEENMECCFVG